jgi:hypothetical protein
MPRRLMRVPHRISAHARSQKPSSGRLVAFRERCSEQLPRQLQPENGRFPIITRVAGDAKAHASHPVQHASVLRHPLKAGREWCPSGTRVMVPTTNKKTKHTLIVAGALQLHDLLRERIHLRILFLSNALLEDEGKI